MSSPSSPLSRASAAKPLVDAVLRAGTPRAFIAAFNAVMKQACPKRALQLLVMTTDTFQKYPGFADCTFIGRNYWSKQGLKGGVPSVSIGFYLVENRTSCVASIELHIESSSDEDPEGGHVGSIYAKTHLDRQKMDLYSLVMAATVLYTAAFAFKFPRTATRKAKLDRLLSECMVVPSMWVLRPYAWVSPGAHEFDKEQNDTYAAYQKYYDIDWDVNIEFRPRANTAAAGRVLIDLCAKNKFCHSLPRLDLPLPKTRKAMGGGQRRSSLGQRRSSLGQRRSGRRQESLLSSKGSPKGSPKLPVLRKQRSTMKNPKHR